MKKSRDSIIDFSYRLLYAGAFSGTVLFCFSGLCGISYVNWRHVAALTGIVALLSAVLLLNRRQQVYAALVSIFAFLSLFLSVGSGRCLLFIRKVLNMVPATGVIGEQEQIEFGRVVLLILVCYFVQLMIEKNIYLRVVSSAVIGGWLLYALFSKRFVPEIGVVFFITYVSLVSAEWIRLNWRKMKNGNTQGYILWIAPFLLLYSMLLSLMPMQKDAYDWQWFKDIYLRAEKIITMYAENLGNFRNEYFDDAASGFSEESGFFGNIVKNDRQLMILGIGWERDMPVYLAGKAFDSFNGHGWENNLESLNGVGNEIPNSMAGSGRFLDAMETVYALERYSDDAISNYYKDIRLDVSYQYFHTNYLLAPSKAWKIEDKEKRVRYHPDGFDLVFNRKAGYGMEYSVRFCQLNMEREEMYRFLESDIDEDERAWNRTVMRYTSNGEHISLEELQALAKAARVQYLPDMHISPETEEWLDFITADAETDVEKLKCIEIALSAMAYNTSPGELPENVVDETSFLDYFLLEKREGYCVHFATAFVLLARAEGFPARYVQGFTIPVVSGSETIVRSDMAHAWPEVYIDGKGWIPFEPTPGFGINRYAAWEKTLTSDTWTAYTGKPASRLEEDGSEYGNELSEGNIEEEQRQSRLLPYMVRVLWILLIGSAIAFGIDWLIEKYREKKKPPDEKYIQAVLHNMQILAMLGFRRKPSETYHELSGRIRRSNMAENDKEGGKLCDIPCRFIETYEEYLYGPLTIDERVVSEVLSERELLYICLKESRRKAYLLCRVKLYITRYR